RRARSASGDAVRQRGGLPRLAEPLFPLANRCDISCCSLAGHRVVVRRVQWRRRTRCDSGRPRLGPHLGLYLSFVKVGQTFYAFGWESLLLETGFFLIFAGARRTEPSIVLNWIFRSVLFRLMFGAGLIKLRGDPCWRDLTCLDY